MCNFGYAFFLSSFLLFSMPQSKKQLYYQMLGNTFELSSLGPRYGDVLIR